MASAPSKKLISGFWHPESSQTPISFSFLSTVSTFYLQNSPSFLLDSEIFDHRYCFFDWRTEGLAKGLKTTWPWLWEVLHSLQRGARHLFNYSGFACLPRAYGKRKWQLLKCFFHLRTGAALLDKAVLNKAGICSLPWGKWPSPLC